MRESFRQSMIWLHTWSGLVVGWVLFFIFLTGTSGYFHEPISRWMRPELPLRGAAAVPAVAPEKGFALAQRFLEEHAGGADAWGMDVPDGVDRTELSVWWSMPEGQIAEGAEGQFGSAVLDSKTGERASNQASAARATGGGELLYRMHYNLHYLPAVWGQYLVGFCSMIMLVALVSGVVAHRRMVKDFFTFRPGRSSLAWLDAHTVIGVVALPFFLMITYSGLAFFLFTYFPAGLQIAFQGDFGLLYNELEGNGESDRAVERSGISFPVPSLANFSAKAAPYWPDSAVTGIRVDFPGDRSSVINLFRQNAPRPDDPRMLSFHAATGELRDDSGPRRGGAHQAQDVLFTLHRGSFAGPVLRWMYFASGLLGCVMIATGLVLWTVKRRSKTLRGDKLSFGHQLVERLNVGTLTGLPAGIAAYFWANRLLPVELASREQWEVAALFAAWALMMIVPAFRPVMSAWREQLLVAGAAFGLLPVVNALTTDRHLGVTLPAGDWELVAFEAVVVALGSALIAAGFRVHRAMGGRADG